jgi:hypothetical protein
MKRKEKLKAKGKKFYKNTQGKICRVRGNYKLTKQQVLRKRQNKPLIS